jgi:exopolysaccharide biosynthesis operon protein EpsL
MAVLVMRRLLGLVMFFSAVSVSAGEGDTLRPFVNASMGYDSNLFRFASDAEAALSAPTLGASSIQSVTYQRFGVGVDLDWRQGRQQFNARVSGDKTRYNKYSSLLDYTGRDMSGEWKWQLGNRWSGLLSASQNRILSPYSDSLAGVIDSNLRTENQQSFQADYWFHTDWRARGRLSSAKSEYSAVSQRSRNNDIKTATFGLYRLGQSVESVAVELISIDGTYPGSAVSDFQEQGLRVSGIWNFSGKTRLTGRVGFIQRDRPAAVVRNFSGPEWRFEGRWIPTGKAQLDAAFFRDLRSNDAVGSGHEVADGVSLTAAWLVAPKTRLVGQGSYEQIAFRGDPRRDKLATLGVSASYEIWRGGDISAGLQHSQRESNFLAAEYKSNSLFVSANLKF